MSEDHVSQDMAPNPELNKRSGIYLSNMTFRIANLRIEIGPDGECKSDARPEISLDVFPHWLEIATGHMERLSDDNARLMEAWKGTDDNAIHKLFELTFRSAMQAITASAVAWDALYGTLRRHVSIPEATETVWRSQRTSRHARILEVIRRGFRIGNRSTQQLKEILAATFKYRGWAVHPPGNFAAPAYHPELGVSTDWRFVAFRHHNAYMIVRAAIGMIPQLMLRPRTLSHEFSDCCSGIVPRVGPLVVRWEARFGPLVSDEVRAQLGAGPGTASGEA